MKILFPQTVAYKVVLGEFFFMNMSDSLSKKLIHKPTWNLELQKILNNLKKRKSQHHSSRISNHNLSLNSFLKQKFIPIKVLYIYVSAFSPNLT